MTATDYWNTYYRSVPHAAALIPSQFAVFVANELQETINTVVEIGCGNGRDSCFFAHLGYRVIGVDASYEAINYCKSNCDGLNVDFILGDISNILTKKQVSSFIAQSSEILIYARFFLHAIDNNTEDHLLNFATTCAASRCLFALEFRTKRDTQLAKSTKPHYRRYIDPLDFLSSALMRQWAIEYFVEGFGYAKQRNDDAHVARVILKRQP